MSAALRSAAGAKAPAARISGPRWRERKDRPIYEVALWPHQSLTLRGLKVVLGVAAAGLALPLVMALGTLVFWGLLPFMLLAFWGLVTAIRRNSRDRMIHETLRLWRDEIRVERHETDGRILRWQAKPMEVRLRLHRDARIESYLTLKGAGREIELGAFLAPEERVALAGEIEAALTRAIRG